MGDRKTKVLRQVEPASEIKKVCDEEDDDVAEEESEDEEEDDPDGPMTSEEIEKYLGTLH